MKLNDCTHQLMKKENQIRVAIFETEASEVCKWLRMEMQKRQRNKDSVQLINGMCGKCSIERMQFGKNCQIQLRICNERTNKESERQEQFFHCCKAMFLNVPKNSQLTRSIDQ